MASLTNWQFLVLGYLVTVAVETPILLAGLRRRHSLAMRLFAGGWLTACTYPIVILTLPAMTGGHYTVVAETFAPVAEILAFRAVCGEWSWRDGLAIFAANLASFSAGLVLFG